ncbi:diguanylate cyclase (GGDEF) domain-containing protein [Nitrosomonas cryotolerans]|uniref:Diguanylate cyclase (GGDEF) domain-containing protein n=1 Tax=Nitrosomonas cryotolerans ATCC 49181 TaxID=1131553 RepID=A0A1N6I727_9PROT|nr:EAL domain-containing protein [Nitrosomonas cryotolerans]SFQ14270.1 diguanylate cyclase (GGDEF) domain-containing protein [Nitrosomonas cryotolerans]SIO27846.1 diguanylate cyclase (GGDEF) domain-containing protein [Nitrosomonas cryotolerans ATCC 49181]
MQHLSDTNTLNAAALDNLRQFTVETGETLLSKAISLFLSTAPKEIKMLQHALDQKDITTLIKIAHGFKSACKSLGAETLADYATSLEKIARQGHTLGIDALLQAIKLNLPDILLSLRQELSKVPATVANKFATHVYPASHNKRILLINGNTIYRVITNEVLTASAFIVDEAKNGLEALKKIKQQKPDLILLDAIMDEFNDFSTCQLLRADSSLANIPIIMSTGLDNIDSINRAYDCGATDFIVNPLNYPILIHRLAFILRANRNAIELENKRHQLSAAQRIARLGYWIWDVEHNHFQMSEQLADFCDINLQIFETTLEGFIRLITPEDRQIVKRMIMAAPYSDTTQHIEYRLQVSQNKIIFVHQEITKIIDNGQNIITGTVQDITQRKINENKIHRLAYFDHLTGLAGRTYYQEHITIAIRTANNNNRNEKFALLFLDLDDFKDINDSLGHNVGDQFLKAVAKRLQEVTNYASFTARLGGDEFCILLTDISNDESITNIAHRCLQQINEPLFLSHQRIKPRISIGIAIFPRDGNNETELMKAAEIAMYAAKQAGKQCYVFYSQDMATQDASRLEKEQILREACEKKQFILHFQPQISMHTGRVTSVEALVRWQHSEKAIVYPGEFISHIEKLGLIVDFGNWVLQTVCEQIAQWRASGLPYLQVAVNISPLHFQDASLPGTVRDLLMKTNIPAQYLELEVTESAMQTKGHVEIFNQLRQLGVKIAIDDFGTGYSCLASLKKLPLDCIKIDKTFIDDVLTSSHTALLVGAIISLANALNYKLVAEGVETRDQALAMRELGCQIIQGYFFCHPVPSDQISALLDVDFTHQLDKDI